MAQKKSIEVQGLIIHIDSFNEKEYVSLTDICKQSKDSAPKDIVSNWIKNTSTIRYLFAWEKLHNPALKKGVQLHALLEKGTDNRFVMSPQKWIELTNAVGLIQKTGRGGGTFAHKDIAINFCYWLSPEFQVYLIKEFQRLAEMEQKSALFYLNKILDNTLEASQLTKYLLESQQNDTENPVK